MYTCTVFSQSDGSCDCEYEQTFDTFEIAFDFYLKTNTGIVYYKLVDDPTHPGIANTVPCDVMEYDYWDDVTCSYPERVSD